jgi:hypothetical protein
MSNRIRYFARAVPTGLHRENEQLFDIVDQLIRETEAMFSRSENAASSLAMRKGEVGSQNVAVPTSTALAPAIRNSAASSPVTDVENKGPPKHPGATIQMFCCARASNTLKTKRI